MKFDRTSMIAITLCFLAYLGWEQHLNKKYPKRFDKPSLKTQTEESAQLKTDAILKAPPEGVPQELMPEGETKVLLSQKDLTLENEMVILTFDQQTAGISSLLLKSFHANPKDGLFTGDLVNLASGGPLELQPFANQNNALWYKGHEAERISEREIVFKRTSDGWQMKKVMTLDEKGFGGKVTFSWKNIEAKSRELVSGVLMQQELSYEKPSFFSSYQLNPLLSTRLNGKVEWHDVRSACGEEQPKEISSGKDQSVTFIGYDQQYFLTALLPKEPRLNTHVGPQIKLAGERCVIPSRYSLLQGLINPGEERTMQADLWFGPKSTQLLSGFHPELSDAVDFGFFSLIARPLLEGLRWIYTLVQNWGVAVILLTMLIKVLFYPLTKKGVLSMKKSQKLAPEMARIKEQFKDDPKRQQQEIMQFMSKNGINPMKGCLPLLLQIPVFFALLKVLSVGIELRQAPFFGWIHDLSVRDPYFVIPLVLGVCMFVQQKLTPMAGLDKTQEKIMLVMPLIFTVTMISLPAGLGLYMITNTLLSILQQQWLNRKFA